MIPTGRSREFLTFLLIAGFLVLAGARRSAAQGRLLAQPAASDSTRSFNLSNLLKIATHGSSSSLDSLRQEIQKYSKAIGCLRDSLELDQTELELSDEQRQRLEETLEDFTGVVESISGQLSKMELEVANNRISLLDEKGDGIVIDIPENLDQQISQGFDVLQKAILSEFPDAPEGVKRHSWTWGLGSRPAPVERKILKGNIIKIGDDLDIASNEDVRGDVVVISGNTTIGGRVDGDVVIILGDLQLAETAEITGDVVTVGGGLEKEPGTDVNDVVVVNPFSRFSGGFSGLTLGPGFWGLGLGFGEFVLVLLLALVALGLGSKAKRERSLVVLSGHFGPCLGVGLVGSLVLLLVGLVLIGVLVVTVIGIPVALLVLVALLLVFLLAVGLAALALGRRVCSLGTGSCGPDWVMLILGLILLNAVAFAGQVVGLSSARETLGEVLLLVGTAIKSVALLVGLGALCLTAMGWPKSSE